ncbi:hypothetical protein ACOSP7_002357 [Xanthoceras sorbifolium]
MYRSHLSLCNHSPVAREKTRTTEIMETKFVEGTLIPESEKDTNEVQDNLTDIELEIDEPEIVDGSGQKKVHQFYFVKFWPYEDRNDNVRSKIEEAEKLIAKINEDENSIFKKHKERMQNYRYRVLSYQHQHQRLCYCRGIRSQHQRLCYSHGIRSPIDQLKWELDHLQEALDKLNFAKNANQRIAIKSCSSRELTNFMLHRPNNLAAKKQLSREINEGQQQRGAAVGSISSVEELNTFIRLLHRKIESLRNNEVRNTILKEIKQFEHVEKKAISNANVKGKNGNPLGSRKAIQDQIRLINKISEELRKERLEEIAEVEIIHKDFNFIMKKLNDIQRKRDEAELHVQNMRRQQNEVRSRYYRYVSVLSTARELATEKQVKALKELSNGEIDIFMSHWNKNKVFRRDYKKRILTSLDHRQLSSDGRIKNLDEESLKPALT